LEVGKVIGLSWLLFITKAIPNSFEDSFTKFCAYHNIRRIQAPQFRRFLIVQACIEHQGKGKGKVYPVHTMKAYWW
jgi:hypothetical protein